MQRANRLHVHSVAFAGGNEGASGHGGNGGNGGNGDDSDGDLERVRSLLKTNL